MSLVESSPLSRGQYSPFVTSSLGHGSANQQVPGSPLSPFFLTAAPRGGQRSGILCSPSSGSPLAQVPDGGSPLLRRLLAGRKRRRDEGSPSPSPSSERSRRHSPRVPNSIIILRRTAVQPTTTANKTKEDQVVPSLSNPPKEERSKEEEKESAGKADSLRTLPEVSDNTKLLDLFGETAEIFASSREE